MFTIFGKKKIKEDIAANVYVNKLLNTIDNGFSDVVGVINDSPEFVASPNISVDDAQHFMFIIIASNLEYLPVYFNNHQGDRLQQLFYYKLSNALGVDQDRLELVIKDYQCFLKKVNRPSKNTRYAISKAIFYKYNLSQFQDDYFKNMNSPNPMFLKRLDELTENFIWNWETFLAKYQLNG